MNRRPSAAPLLAAALLLPACVAKGVDSGAPVLGDTPSAWLLVDENLSSASAGEERGPMTERGHVSAWYFGHST
ncbi:MAG: hypothetical protein JNM72_04600 [Deltaproteobacteria bacterium]|jgi:hypothetical protein|nr:hypothetical protein [Deltaproteobacteria bacterium]